MGEEEEKGTHRAGGSFGVNIQKWAYQRDPGIADLLVCRDWRCKMSRGVAAGSGGGQGGGGGMSVGSDGRRCWWPTTRDPRHDALARWSPDKTVFATSLASRWGCLGKWGGVGS